jgi:hypothetical protein
MNEQLISFETAKLAKEVGFPQEQFPSYVIPKDKNKEVYLTSIHSDHFRRDRTFFVSTQPLLQRWLREVHNILLFVNHRQYGVSSCDGYYAHIGLSIHNMEFSQSKTYEECMEIGLQEALKLIVC